MSIGMTIEAIAGLVLAAPWGLAEGVELNYAKIGVKLGVNAGIAVLW